MVPSRVILLLFLISVCQATPFYPKKNSPFLPSLSGLTHKTLSYRNDESHQKHRNEVLQAALERYTSDSVSNLRAGDLGKVSATAKTFVSILQVVFDVVTTACQLILPPLTAAGQVVYKFYSTLPKDLIAAQIGLVYCFAGGYFPTLFAAVQAAEHAGVSIMVGALGDLIDEGVQAVEAIQTRRKSNRQPLTPRQALQQSTAVVMATVDPVKINEAASALYTTWLGVSVVLEREFAQTISMSLTISENILPIASKVLSPPMYLVVPDQYHQWVPIVVGWACKAAAMSVAWRIERILTASTSALMGGCMFARAVLRMTLHKQADETRMDEALGYTVAALGLYSQIGDGFDFDIPFPLSLVTWPFSFAENWIQWQITREAS